MYTSKAFSDYGLNMEHANLLTNILKKVAKENQYGNATISFCETSSKGANYTSKLYLATIFSPIKKDLKLFVKVGAMGDIIRSDSPVRIYAVESFFYRILKKIYEELEVKNVVPPEHRLVTPKFYAVKESPTEVLVLEDLTVAGYKTYDRFKPITWEYAKSSVINLVKLHALSIAWSVEDPEAFKKSADLLNLEVNRGQKEYFEKVAESAFKITKDLNKAKLLRYIKSLPQNNDLNKFQISMRRPVIAFGDYRPSNLLHKEHENGSFEIISVDYQTLRIGNPIADVIYFMFTGSDKAFRKQYFKKTIELYYSELYAALKRLNVDPDSVYPREDFDYEWERILPYGLLLSMASLLIITVNEEEAPKVDELKEMKDFAVRPSQLYTERLNDIIDDYIDMGII